MAKTSVYFSSNLEQSINVRLTQTGPGNCDITALASVGPQPQSKRIASLGRAQVGIGSADLAFIIGDTYIGSLGIFLVGSDFGSSMWHRYRTISKVVLPWVTYRDPHSITRSIGGVIYVLTVQAQSVWLGYDDLTVTLSTGD